MRSLNTLFRLGSVLVALCALPAQAFTQQDQEGRNANATIARQLASNDPLARQRAAEELARLAAVDQKKLLDGYYLQEKDRKVRLALEWALYRVGRAESLFRIVRELDTSRHEQAVGYLRQVDNPSLLYPFLKQQDSPAKVTVGLLEALAELGDSETLELIRPYRDSFGLGVAEAAEYATDKIEARLAQTETPVPTRPRTVGKTDPTSP